MVLAALSAILAISNLTSSQSPKGSVTKLALRTPINGTQSMAAVSQVQHNQAAPCQCEPSNPSWATSQRTAPKCIFVDLGAADGNSFQSFLNNVYGPVASCPSGGQWEAFLVEANPRFQQKLQDQEARYPGSVHSYSSTAAFDCEGTTTFYLDTTTHEHNYWGSSMSGNHPDVQRSGYQHVSVQLMNLNRLVHEHTIPSDYVIVKMDIEGAEWDILPCLAQSPAASLIDIIYMEVHGADLGLTGTTPAQFNAAKAALQQKGVHIPDYSSPTL